MARITPLGNRVLVVDDDEGTRLLAQRGLQSFGFIVELADGGKEALAAINRCVPDLALIDMLMPDLDGFQLCQAIHERSGCENLPVVIMTARDDTESINRAYEIGATDFAPKPINWTVLGQRIRYILRASHAMDELSRSRRSLADAHRLAGLSSWEWDIVEDKMYWSKEIYHAFGMPDDSFDVSLDTFWSIIHPDDQEAVHDALVAALKRERSYSQDYRIVLPTGAVHTIHVQAETEYGSDGRALRMRGTIQDITERKRTEEKIRQLAFFDSLTTLPNRMLFKEQLGQALQRARRERRHVAVLFLDLDHFKRINDTLGHTVGDELLQNVAKRLAQCVRSEDSVARAEYSENTSTVARLGGDEFTVLLSNIEDARDAARVAQRIIDALQEPIALESQEVVASTSIGIAISPTDGDDIESLLKHADAAMYHAKSLGRGHYQFYNKSVNATAIARLELEGSLRRALDQNEFVLHYQPVLDGHTYQVIGAEALVRWQHPDKGLLMPLDFIRFAEEAGLIIPLGNWVLYTACQQARQWQTMGLPTIAIAVNISSVQLRQLQFAEQVRYVLQRTGLSPQHLVLEVTESMLIDDTETALTTLSQLRAIGVRIAIDDFGTGFSSLMYLKRLPVDTLKIDQTFIKNVGTDGDNSAIASAVIALAHSLKLNIVAEGVETGHEREFLTSNGCATMQGYFFSRPLTSERFAQALAEGVLSPVALTD